MSRPQPYTRDSEGRAVTQHWDVRISAPGWRPLAALLATAGVSHFAAPRVYERIVPPLLGDPRPWVRWSGVAEIACAAGLAFARTRRPAALASAALFVAVYPANVQQAIDAYREGSRGARIATLARLPAQLPLVLWALRVHRTPSPSRAR
jgi:uncharacterized membrane protein